MHPADLRQVLDIAEHVAAELAAAAVDPAADLTTRERRALVALSLAVEAQAAWTVGIEPQTPEAHAVLARAMLATIEADPTER